MGNFFNGLKRAFRALAEGTGPGRYEVEGRPVRCPHCGHETFAEGEAMLNTVGMTFFGLDWANRTASTLMCAECGRIEWFGQKPARL
jgi:DNA-directed RNA polymerase subunit RPC12/RpoP